MDHQAPRLIRWRWRALAQRYNACLPAEGHRHKPQHYQIKGSQMESVVKDVNMPHVFT